MVDIKKLEQKALKILEKKPDIYFFSDLCVELGYARQYLYEQGFCPDKNDILKQALENNKKIIKRGLRNKWYQNDNNYANTSHDNAVNMSVGTTIRCLKE